MSHHTSSIESSGVSLVADRKGLKCGPPVKVQAQLLINNYCLLVKFKERRHMRGTYFFAISHFTLIIKYAFDYIN